LIQTKDPLPYDSSNWGKTLSSEKFEFNLKRKYSNAAMPTVIGAGAKKCGTGAFSFFMRQNDHFKGARGGEAHFFYDSEKLKDGFEEYSKHFRGYAKFMNDSTFGNTVVFEGTPRYLVENLVPERVKDKVKKFCSNISLVSKNHKSEKNFKFRYFLCSYWIEKIFLNT